MEENPYKAPVKCASSRVHPKWAMMFVGFGVVAGVVGCVVLVILAVNSANVAEQDRLINETIANEFAVESRRMFLSAAAVACLVVIACRWVIIQLRDESPA